MQLLAVVVAAGAGVNPYAADGHLYLGGTACLSNAALRG
ncbi:hypothetical protein ARZXY2_4544 (plasmid) [Arthrobacter sp. ZXY-2]|nr:hypothetical protein ARZXY2_4544 [Arthrobacter sp. ZXY-2]